MKRKKCMLILVCVILVLFPAVAKNSFRIAVYVPGVVKGNPTYEMLTDGVKEAQEQLANGKNPIQVKIIEGGVNQGEWQKGLTALALSRKYDLIVSSNPSLPALAEKVLAAAPQQKFLLLDGFSKGNPHIKAIGFNQYEQGYLNGHYAALISMSDMPHANAAYRIGLLAGQEFPVMNNYIRKGFLAGAKAADPRFELDFRVLGNWYDAAKAAEIVSSMIKNGADVILTICGGGNAGAVSAAREHGAYIMWFDSPGYRYGSEVVGSTQVALKKVCTAAVLKAAAGTLDYGTPSELGIADDAVGFVFDGIPASVPASVIERQKQLIENLTLHGTVLQTAE